MSTIQFVCECGYPNQGMSTKCLNPACTANQTRYEGSEANMVYLEQSIADFLRQERDRLQSAMQEILDLRNDMSLIGPEDYWFRTLDIAERALGVR